MFPSLHAVSHGWVGGVGDTQVGEGPCVRVGRGCGGGVRRRAHGVETLVTAPVLARACAPTSQWPPGAVRETMVSPQQMHNSHGKRTIIFSQA